MPSIEGTATFSQFWSIRQTRRQCGRISLSEHWKQWAALGMALGKIRDVNFFVETAGGGSGFLNLNYATIQVNSPVSAGRESARHSEHRSWATSSSGSFTLVSLDGKNARSIDLKGTMPTGLRTAGLPQGLYVLRYQGNPGTAPMVHKVVLE